MWGIGKQKTKYNLTVVSDIFKFIIDLMTMQNKNSVNLDIEDIKTVINQREITLFGIEESYGDKSVSEVIENILKSSQLDDMYIVGVSGVIIHFYISTDYPITDISDAMNMIYGSADENADVIFGTTVDENLAQGYVKVTIIAAD